MSAAVPQPAAGAFVVIAELQVVPHRWSDFVPLARSFAAQCLAREPGCRQFDVVLLETSPYHVLFFEAYDDAVAFEAHCASDHLAQFKAGFVGMVRSEQPLRRGWREWDDAPAARAQGAVAT